MEENNMSFKDIGTEIGALVDEKNSAYGNSFAVSGEFLKLLYPDGIHPDQFADALLLVRMFDKMMRVANKKDAFGESPYGDLAGYSILGVSKDRQPVKFTSSEGSYQSEEGKKLAKIIRATNIEGHGVTSSSLSDGDFSLRRKVKK